MTIAWEFRFDGLAWAMLALVVGVGVLVAWHVVASLPAYQRRRVLGLLAPFALAMGVLVTADDLLLLFTAWEITSILSFLLVGTKDTKAYARKAARRALAVTGGGGLCLLAGIVLLRQVTGVTRLSELAELTPTGTGATWAAILFLVGAATKAAQSPFHGWLPGAMAAPAPVSAYLHSATMVKAGIYLAARLSPTFHEVPVWDAMIVVTAGASVLYGGWRAFRVTDLKALFAWSTVSQLGFIMLAVTAHKPKVVLGGMALLLAHAAAKGALFLSVGSVDERTGTRELGDLRGLGRVAPVQVGVITLALLSLSGLFPTYGFVAKEGALLGMIDGGYTARLVLFALGSVLTASYSTVVIRELWSARRDDEPALEVAEPTAGLVVAPLLMVLPVLVLGIGIGFGQEAAAAMRDAISGPAGLLTEDLEELKLFPAPGLALWLSLGSVALGAAFGLVPALGRLLTGTPDTLEIDRWDVAVDATLDSPGTVGERIVGVLRPDERRITVGLMLGALGLLAAPALLATGTFDELWASPTELVTMLVLVAACGTTAVMRHRFGAILSLGTVGFSMVGWFAARSAPDLALTQGLVETIIVIAFLVVLRELPSDRTLSTDLVDRLNVEMVDVNGDGKPDRPNRVSFGLRALVSTGVALAGVGVALAINAHPGGAHVADAVLERSLPEGEGRNVVNVVLTDVRSLDTLAEITVIALAGVGAARLFRRREHDDEVASSDLVQHETEVAA